MIHMSVTDFEHEIYEILLKTPLLSRKALSEVIFDSCKYKIECAIDSLIKHKSVEEKAPNYLLALTR